MHTNDTELIRTPNSITYTISWNVIQYNLYCYNNNYCYIFNSCLTAVLYYNANFLGLNANSETNSLSPKPSAILPNDLLSVEFNCRIT